MKHEDQGGYGAKKVLNGPHEMSTHHHKIELRKIAHEGLYLTSLVLKTKYGIIKVSMQLRHTTNFIQTMEILPKSFVKLYVRGG